MRGDNDLSGDASIDDIAITSDPGSDAIYGTGDTIEATVTFDGVVHVTDEPRLTLTVGTPIGVLLGIAARDAVYTRGSGSKTLVFAYTVAAGDNDPDGVSIAADSLVLDGGAIDDGDDKAALLSHDEVGAQSGHRVDTVAPALSDISVEGSQLTIRYTESLDEASVPGTNQFEVRVEDVLRTVSGVAVAGKFVTLTLMTPAVLPGERVRAGYTVPATSPIRDQAGLRADAFANEAVTNYTLPTVSITALDAAVYEGVELDFTLARNGPVTDALNVRVLVDDRGDVLDESEGYRDVRFAVGSSTAPLTLSTLDDHEYEPHTAVIATVEGAQRYAVSNTAGSATVTVSDNDVPETDLALEGPASVAETAGHVTVLVRASTVRDEKPHGSVTVRLLSADGTAQSGPDGDFAAVDVLVRFDVDDFERIETDGQPRHVATTERQVPIHDDTVSERDETFTLILRRPGGVPANVNLPDTPLVVGILDSDVPGMPMNVKVASADGGLAVSWSAVDGATGYKVQWKSGAAETFATAAAHGRQRVVTGGSTTSAAIGSLTNGTRYTVRVIAANSGGDGPASAQVTGTPRPAPARVTGVTVASDDGELAVSWNAVAGATGYKVQWKSGAAETFETAATHGREHVVSDPAATRYTIGNLANETEYTVRVIATNAGVDGPASEEVAGTPAYEPAQAPPGTTLVSNTGCSVDNSFGLGQSTVERYTQGFTTGAHTRRFRLDSIGISIRSVSPGAGETVTAYLYSTTGTGALGSRLYALTTPTRFASDAVHLFTAPRDAVLQADTRYLLAFTGTSPSALDFRVNATRENAEDPGKAEGWSIDDALHVNGVAHSGGESLMLGVNGGTFVSGNAKLSELTLVGAGVPVALNEAFDPERRSYTAAVGHAVNSLAVSARAADERANVVLPDDDDGGTPGSQVELEVGDNAIVVKVKAENGRTRRYTVTVRRAGVPVTASVSGAPAEHGGANARFHFELHLSRHVAISYKVMRDHAFSVTGGRISGAKRLNRRRTTIDGKRRTLSNHWRIGVVPEGDGPVSLSLAAERPCTERGAMCAVDGGRVSNALELAVLGPGGATGIAPVTVSIADATGDEDDEVIVFPLTVSRAVHAHMVAVDFETVGGSAVQDVDYWALDGTMVFDLGQTEIEMHVALRDDAVDDGGETFTVKLGNARIVDPYAPGFLEGNAIAIADDEATGTINNADPMPRAWLARFARTAAGHVVDAVRDRIEAPRSVGLRGTLAGVELGAPEGSTGTAGRRAGWNARETRLRAMRNEPPGVRAQAGTSTRDIAADELLAGSAFALTGGNGGGSLALWGRGARSRFEGREDRLTLGGEVTSATLGMDWSHGPWLAGIAFAHSTGDGTWRQDGSGGEVDSSLTGVYPYTEYEATGRLSLWATGGYAEGALTLHTPHESLRTDISMAMSAVGVAGALLPRTGSHGPALELEADALWVHTTSDAVSGMNASRADASRLRFALAGDWVHPLEGGGMLTPSLETGLRYDGGDAETGFGVEIGGGLAFAGASGRLAAELSGRTLLMHQADGLRDWGVSGALRFDPHPSSERGLTLSLRPAAGGATTGGADTLMRPATMPAPTGVDGAARLDAEAAYGHRIMGGRFIGAPYAGLGLSEHGRDYTLGWRLVGVRSADADIAFEIEGTRRLRGGTNEAANGIAIRFAARW